MTIKLIKSQIKEHINNHLMSLFCSIFFHGKQTIIEFKNLKKDSQAAFKRVFQQLPESTSNSIYKVRLKNSKGQLNLLKALNDVLASINLNFIQHIL